MRENAALIHINLLTKKLRLWIDWVEAFRASSRMIHCHSAT
jgi:hypothetical protein